MLIDYVMPQTKAGGKNQSTIAQDTRLERALERMQKARDEGRT